MNTATMHISLPESLKRFVKEQAEKDHYSNPSDYMRALIRAEQKRQAEKRLEDMLLEGLASGSRTFGPEQWKELKEKVLASVEKKSSSL